jgi:3-mercaptopyruvate sulfurtransferase SseA
MLKTFGHPDVRILDGGLQKWKAAGYPVLSSSPVQSDDFYYNYNPKCVCNFDDVIAITENRSA